VNGPNIVNSSNVVNCPNVVNDHTIVNSSNVVNDHTIVNLNNSNVVNDQIVVNCPTVVNNPTVVVDLGIVPIVWLVGFFLHFIATFGSFTTIGQFRTFRSFIWTVNNRQSSFKAIN
jgi:hypothetical protein